MSDVLDSFIFTSSTSAIFRMVFKPRMCRHQWHTPVSSLSRKYLCVAWQSWQVQVVNFYAYSVKRACTALNSPENEHKRARELRATWPTCIPAQRLAQWEFGRVGLDKAPSESEREKKKNGEIIKNMLETMANPKAAGQIRGNESHNI